jgi:hypothetical protein
MLDGALRANASRRAALQARSARLRNEFSASAQALQAPLAAADRVRDAVHWCRERPWLLGLAAGAFALVKPGRVLSLGMRVWGGWRLWRQVRSMF